MIVASSYSTPRVPLGNRRVTLVHPDDGRPFDRNTDSAVDEALTVEHARGSHDKPRHCELSAIGHQAVDTNLRECS